MKWSFETSLMLAIARFLIKFIPFRYWRWTLGDFESAIVDPIGSEDFNRTKALYVGRWVQRTAKNLPFEAVCLPQAMACRWMLARRGLRSKIFLGVKREDDAKEFAYHAWIMHGELCLTGHHEKDSYTAFLRQK